MATKWTERLSMFSSARWNLTLFYLAIIALFNLLITLSVRVYAEHEFNRSNYAQRIEVRDWVIEFVDRPSRSTDMIGDIQETHAAIVRQHLNQSLLIINIFALGIGGLLSYWFAGRTLKPIERAHETQARFTADASHELRTPLANMKLENEVFLRQKDFTTDEAREQIESNLQEVQRLERLSNNLLALHQYGQAALVRTPVDIEDIVNASIAQFEQTAVAKNVAIHHSIAKGMVMVHKESMIQLLDILIDNALKYGARGGEVTVSGRQLAQGYQLTVQDRGPGISADDLPYIFDRLYRGDKARSATVAGYGLGLALAKEIATANRSILTAQNRSGGGACFTLTLPFAA